MTNRRLKFGEGIGAEAFAVAVEATLGARVCKYAISDQCRSGANVVTVGSHTMAMCGAVMLSSAMSTPSSRFTICEKNAFVA